MPAIVPRIVATVEDRIAISSDSISARPTCGLFHSAPYHLAENPPQTVASRELLNE